MTRSSSLYSIVIILVHITSVISDCVTYDVCYETKTYSNYCPANNRTRIPQPLSPEHEDLRKQLAQKCPHLFAGGNDKLCCTGSQLKSLFNGMTVPNSLLQRCPACLDNFWKNWCEYTCSPNQADFVQVVTVETSAQTNLSYVTKVQYDISRDFADSMFNSCKDVQLGTGGQALKLMCGKLKPNETCKVEQWLGFMGTRNPAMGIPTDIDYIYHNSSSLASYMHVNTTRCDQAPRAGMSKCSRTDCPLVPLVHDFFPEDTGTQESCRLLGIGCTVYFLILAVLVFVTILVCVLTSYCCRRKDKGSLERIRRAASESDWGALGSMANWIPKQVEVNSGLFGEFVTKQGYLTALFGVFLAVVCCSGLAFLTMTINPVEMWAPPNSRTIQEKKYFDTQFGPFYRVQQIIMYPTRPAEYGSKIGPVFEKDFLTEVFGVIRRVKELVAYTSDNRRVTLAEICHRPMGPGYDCLINSPTNYFSHQVEWLNKTFEPEPEAKTGDEEVFDYYDESAAPKKESGPAIKTYLDHLHDCIGNPYTTHSSFNISCLGSFGGPTFPYLVFGGEAGAETDFMKSSAVTISILLSSRASMKKMLAWEESFIQLMKEYKHESVQLSFMAERSIMDEIQREGVADAYTVVIASLLMIFYVIFALGQYTVENNRLSTIFIHSKILVGLCGVSCIAAAAASSIGILSLYGNAVPSTAIVVQCFVTLFLGSNRMFLTIRAIQSQPTFPGEAMNVRLYRICSNVLPTMLTCAVAQGVIFCVGAFSPVPAVRSFSLMAALSITFQFVFHCTVFLPVCVWDLKREEEGKSEILCCMGYEMDLPEPVERGYVEEVMDYCAPYLMSTPVRIFIIGLVCLFFCCSPVAFPRIEMGLDRKMAVPEDSYVQIHFKNMDKYMNVGPPVYFVIQGDIDFSDKYWQDKMCTLGGCADDSVGAILAQAVDNPKKTYLKGEVLNWLDSYIEWLSPSNDCCKVAKSSGKPEYCPSSQRVPGRQCNACDHFTSDGRPSKNIFYKHLKQFTEDVPNEHCVQGGRAAFHDAIHMDPRGHVDSSYMMTFHVPLRNSSDFIAALEGARMVSRKIEHALNNTVKVFPYSVFYVFYDQFLTIRTESAYQLVFAMTGLFLSVLLLNGLDAWSAIIIVLTCLFNLIFNVVMLAVWNLEINNISAVNLLMAVATSTEFTIPMVMAFLNSAEKTRLDRAKDGFVKAGPTILCGVTLTSLLGTLMLAFAHSPFFKVYFFRMLLTMGLGGAFCGLVFLPTVLSFWGPPCKTKLTATPSCEIEHSSESRRLPTRASTRRGDGDHSSEYSKEALDSLNPLLPPPPPPIPPARLQPRLD